jgi:hypothetical protein
MEKWKEVGLGETRAGEKEAGERESRFGVSSPASPCWSSLSLVMARVGVYIRRLDEIGEAGEAASPIQCTPGIPKTVVGEVELDTADPNPKPNPDPRVEENGSLIFNPKPLSSVFSSFFPCHLMESLTPPLLISSVETVVVSLQLSIWCANGLDVVTALLLPALGSGVNPLTRKGDEHSFLTEEAKVGRGICEGDGEGVQYFPGGAIQSGFGGEGGLGVAEVFRGGLGFGGEWTFAAAEGFRCRAGCGGEDVLVVVDTFRC